MIPLGAIIGLTTTWSPIVKPVTALPISTTSPAGSWPSGMCPLPKPPIEMYRLSDPQIPQARILIRTSFGPTVGFGTSITWVSFGPVITVAFIVAP